jgi:hypothetical protein
MLGRFDKRRDARLAVVAMHRSTPLLNELIAAKLKSVKVVDRKILQANVALVNRPLRHGFTPPTKWPRRW